MTSLCLASINRALHFPCNPHAPFPPTIKLQTLISVIVSHQVILIATPLGTGDRDEVLQLTLTPTSLVRVPGSAVARVGTSCKRVYKAQANELMSWGLGG